MNILNPTRSKSESCTTGLWPGLRLLSAAMLLPAGILAAADSTPDYGADKVNSMGATNGTVMGGADNYNYLALKNHKGPSGVPLGGIGVGYFCYTPEGSFTRFAINNWQDQGSDRDNPIIKDVNGTFLAVWENGHARLLQRTAKPQFGMPPSKQTVYTGLFPVAKNAIDNDVQVCAWSGLTPHNVKDSSLPAAWLEVTVKNPGPESRGISVALSWEDVVGRRLCDIANLDAYKKGAAPQTVAINRNFLKTAGWYNWMPRVSTQAIASTGGGFTGIRQFSQPLAPHVWMLQNYNNQVAILAEQQPGAKITVLPAYSLQDPEAAWASFRKTGELTPVSNGAVPLFDPASPTEKASAVAVSVNVPAGGQKTVRFLVSWFSPQVTIDPKTQDSSTYFAGTDYNHYYHNYFQDQDSLIRYLAANRGRIFDETVSWHEPVLNSSYPDWLKFKLINSSYTLYTNAILNKPGNFSVLEGAMGGLAGTMDQRLAAHPFYQKFLPELDRAELELFGHNPGKEGQILHFDGYYYFGMSSRDGSHSLNLGWMVDNTGGWLVQLAKIYQQTGDAKWIGQFRSEIPAAMNFLYSLTKKNPDFFIVEGATTYDDFWHPPIYAYNAGCWPAFLRAGAVLYRALGDEKKASQCDRDSLRASQDFIKALWNGRFFAYGSEIDGSSRQDNIMFSGQLAGQFLSRYCGWGDVIPFPMILSSLKAQMETNVGLSKDYYAPKVWQIDTHQAMHDPRRPGDRNNDSTCWPFYLESYTAMAAIQAGMVSDGLEIMKHIQLVHLRNGWTWSQNLWRPGELTYMTAPVTWFITDVLAGASLDVTKGELTLGPVNLGENEVLPLYYPGFWAQLENNPREHHTRLRVLKTFGTQDAVISKLRIEPNGRPTDEARESDIPPFTVKEGAVLDLDAFSIALNASHTVPPMLPLPSK